MKIPQPQKQGSAVLPHQKQGDPSAPKALKGVRFDPYSSKALKYGRTLLFRPLNNKVSLLLRSTKV